MIFVTVGTHEQPFNRLIKKIDNLVKNDFIKEKVMIQTGFSTYKPKYCQYQSMISFKEMKEYIDEAHIIITHGGPSSFIEVLQEGKVPIVVPRLKKYGEHINNHQYEFIKFISKKQSNIIPVYDLNKLSSVINDYDNIISKKSGTISSHNKQFNLSFDAMVKELI